ncbi:MAG: hypothetical protein ABIJ12_12370 [bacterium]
MKKTQHKFYIDTIILLIVIMLSVLHLSCDNKPTEPENFLIGDLNLNGTANEIADAVLYTHYFVYGDSVFSNPELNLKATDVNQDGVYPDIADLYFMIHFIVGDALPYPEDKTITAYVDQDNVLYVHEVIGAAHVVIRGNVTPILLADNMNMDYKYDLGSDVTRALVYSMNLSQSFKGKYLDAQGIVISYSMATTEGGRVITDALPRDNIKLNQNYPNPFIINTTISFEIAKAQEVTLLIRDINNKILFIKNDFYAAGYVEIIWPPTDFNLNRGFYYYSVITKDEFITKTMMKL